VTCEERGGETDLLRNGNEFEKANEKGRREKKSQGKKKLARQKTKKKKMMGLKKKVVSILSPAFEERIQKEKEKNNQKKVKGRKKNGIDIVEWKRFGEGGGVSASRKLSQKKPKSKCFRGKRKEEGGRPGDSCRQTARIVRNGLGQKEGEMGGRSRETIYYNDYKEKQSGFKSQPGFPRRNGRSRGER